MSTATQGRRREHQVRDDLVAHGWRYIMRAAASKGSADLLMGHPAHGAALIQVGTANKRLGPDARARFLADADACCALPIVASVTRGQITYWLATAETPGKWEQWSA